MNVRHSKQVAFFEDLHPASIFICGVGGAAFCVSFFLHDIHGVSRALGLVGIGIFVSGLTLNLLLQAAAGKVEAHQKRHLLTQAVFTSILALAVFLLAAYLFRHGTLPDFMPARYGQHQSQP
jgi:hypothetical protein